MRLYACHYTTKDKLEKVSLGSGNETNHVLWLFWKESDGARAILFDGLANEAHYACCFFAFVAFNILFKTEGKATGPRSLSSGGWGRLYIVASRR